MLTISRAVLLAAMFSLSAIPAVGLAAAAAQQNTTTSFGVTTTVTIPTVTAVDSNMDEAAIRDAIGANFMSHAGDLAKLSASSITIPEIDVKLDAPDPDKAGARLVTDFAVKDIVLSSVKDGVAEGSKIGSISAVNPEVDFELGSVSTGTLDIGGLLGLYGLTPGAADQPMAPVYKDFSFTGGSVKTPMASCSIGKLSAPEFDARPLKVSFAQMMDASSKLAASKDNPPPDAIATYVSFMSDVFQAYTSQPMTMGPMSCSGTNPDGQPFQISFGGLMLDGFQPGIYPAVTVTDVKISGGSNGTVSLDKAQLKAIDLHGPLAVVDAQKGDFSQTWLTANWRKLIPSFAGFSFSGLKIDVPSPDDASMRYTAAVDSFDLTLADYLNGIPTKIATKASGVDVPIPPNTTDDTEKMLLSLGITRIDLDYELAANWDKASQAISIDKMNIAAKDLGSIGFAAVIGNATDQLFDPDPDVEMAAGQGVTIKSIKIDLADTGISDKLLPILAQQQGVSDVAAFRTQMAGQAEGAALQMLGSTDAARQLGAAIGDFVSGKAKAVSITITAKDPAGIGIPALTAAADDPTALANAVDIVGSTPPN